MIKGKDKVFLIDGYPRNQANIDGWKEVFGDNYVLVTSIILDCDEDTLVKRLMERGTTSGRADDNIETIKKRFKTHKEESEPIVKELKKMGPFIEGFQKNIISARNFFLFLSDVLKIN